MVIIKIDDRITTNNIHLNTLIMSNINPSNI